MYLKYLQIVNYKNLKSARFEFAKGANTIIGENDSGKSNALTAMRILLDDSYFYNTKRLKESDFSYELDDWKGHWIIISAFFDDITEKDRVNEICAELSPEEEDVNFLKSYIRCKDMRYGTVSLFIRPNKATRTKLFNATDMEDFEDLRSKIKLNDYEFFYSARSQTDFTDENNYEAIVGDISNSKYTNPEDEDCAVLGSSFNILHVWEHVSLVFIDALRDVETELRKPKNPIRRIVDTIEGDISESDLDEIKQRIKGLNKKLSSIPQISDIGQLINAKLIEMIGMVYSPNIKLESRLKEDFATLAKYLTISPSDQQGIELLGLGHLNILYMALKLVEFEANRNHEILNIMVIEEPEAHIHTHIQKTLFNSLQVTRDYTQVIMSTHSTHLSEVADIEKVNVMKNSGQRTIVMKPTTGLSEFGATEFNNKNFITSLTRYLDAKRSVLLFSKGVLLVEGDGEEILIPALIKAALGVSLDELGVGLINIGSVAFENIACIFDKTRIQRNCAIITDSDAVVEGATKGKPRAAELGESRKQKLDKLFTNNPYIKTFVAPHTLEIDFANEKSNREFIKKILLTVYKSQETITNYSEILDSGTEAERYDVVFISVNHVKKGWYATLLATSVDYTVQIPKYIIEAIAFASREIIDEQIIWKMVRYFCIKHEGAPFLGLKTQMIKANSLEERAIVIKGFRDNFSDETLSIFLDAVGWK
ncbi:MAG: AAA family ATPase [Sphaerochaeta sp.]|nr:AAA family ATPase [Sphaerochaeta sp.]